jgi:hypothetical protein
MAKSASRSWGDLIDGVRSTTGHVCRLPAIKTHHRMRIDRDSRGTAVTRIDRDLGVVSSSKSLVV